MKISSLLENITPSSSPANTTSPAPKFGRDEDNLEETTSSGAIGTVAQPVGGMQRRGKGSIFSGIKTSKKFPNSKSVKEGAYEDGVSDGMRGQVNRRASSIYGPSSGEYDKGYAVGVQKGKEQQQARVSQAQQDSQPYEQMSDEELIQLRKDIQQRTQERQKIYSKLRGSDYTFDPKRHRPPNDNELKAQGAADNKAWHIINQVLWQRGVNIDKLSEGPAEVVALAKFAVGGGIPGGQKPSDIVDEQDMTEEQLDELSCWSGYHRVKGTKAGFPGSCAKNKTNEEQELEEKWSQKYKDSINCSNPKGFSQKAHCAGKNKNEDIQEEKCPECGGPMFNELLINEKKDACYYKVKSRYKVWPSAYASGALVKCRKKGADSWGNGGKKNESVEEIEENLHKWFKEKWVRFGPDGKIRGDCARGDDSEGKPKCLPQAKAHSLGKKGRKYAAAKKRREDPNPERSGKAINVSTKKKSNEGVAEGSENLNYIGNCTEDDVIEHIFGDATHFAQAVEEHGDEFTIDDLVVKYDPKTDVHSFYYKKKGVAEAQPETHQGSRLDDLNRSTMARYGQELNDLISKIEFHKQGQAASQYKGSMNKMHSEKIRELLAQIEQLKRQYGLNEVSDKTLTSYLTKVDADSQKHEKDPTKRSAEKRNKSVQGFSRAFNKLDARKGKEELDEKSVSKAQFRTMAAVAHNPEFAKKVGISQKVGKEFHKADKKQDYSKLPKKVDEAELSEEQLLAKDLMKHFQLFKKGKDKDLSNRPGDKEIQTKVSESDSEPILPGAPKGVEVMSMDQFVGQDREVDEATKLPAQSRELGSDEFQDYMTRIVGTPDIDKKTGQVKTDKKGNEKYISGKTKTDKYKLPYIHRSSAIEYYDESGKRFKEEAIISALQQRPAKLLKQNEKMKHSNGELEQFFNVGFAALTGVAVDESTGKLIVVNTCPGAGSCKVDCFAMKGGKVQFKAAWLSDGRILTYLLNDPDGFFSQLSNEISKEEKAGQKGGYTVTIRWHDAGDFFSPEYLDLALKMAKQHPNVKFYAYTKMAGAALAQKPKNFIINWSEGANTGQEKQVKAQDPSLDTTKNSRIVPEKLFYDLLAKDAKGNLAKGPAGQWQVANPDALAELKQRLAQAYKISPSSILSYDEYIAKRKSIPQGMKYNVIVAPGEGDISANDQNVLSTLLLRH